MNWKIIDLLKQELVYSDINSPRFLDYGGCPLHIAHGALLTDYLKSGWTICATLSSAFYLLNDSPARRADYEVATNSSIYPQKFCRTRLVENVSVEKRFLEIFDNLKLYVENVKSLRTKALSSWQTLDKSFKDPFLKAKISFLISVAQDVEPFLQSFQTQNPVFPLLYDEILFIMSNLLKRIVVPTKLETISARKLASIDLTLETDLLPLSKTKLGMGTNAEIEVK